MLNDTSSILSFLATRKSASAKAMGGPGPTRQQLQDILKIAVRVPDHGKLTPWRFLVFEGEARSKIGEAFGARWRELNPQYGDDAVNFQRGLFMRAPTVLGVVSCAAPHAKIPEWEQVLSAAAVCFSVNLAATAMGFGAQWQTDWVAYDREVAGIMGLAAHEKIAGFIYLGTSTVELEDRPRPDIAKLVTLWGA